MFVRYWIICSFLLLIVKVSLQDPDRVTGDEGGSVILPCSYKNRTLQPEEVNVFWRYNQVKKVYDIVKGNPSTEKQDEMFKGRIQSLHSDYEKGDFSLRLSNLTLSDGGLFSCDIPDGPKKQEISLIVRAVTTTSTPTTVSTPKPKVNARNSSMRTQPERIVTFLIVALEFLFCTVL